MGAIVKSDYKYLIKLLDRFLLIPQNVSQTSGMPDSPPPFLVGQYEGTAFPPGGPFVASGE